MGEHIRLSDTLHTPVWICANTLRSVKSPIVGCVWCENIHTTPCRRIHTIFWYPTHTCARILLIPYTHFGPHIFLIPYIHIQSSDALRIHTTFWHPTHTCARTLLIPYTHFRPHILLIQPIVDRVAWHLEIISKIFQSGTWRTRILLDFLFYYLVLIENPMGRILVRWKRFRNHLEMLCHPICNRLYPIHAYNLLTPYTHIRLSDILHTPAPAQAARGAGTPRGGGSLGRARSGGTSLAGVAEKKKGDSEKGEEGGGEEIQRVPGLPVCMTWLIRMLHMTHTYVGHDSYICVTWLVRMLRMTPANVWHDSFVCCTWLMHMWDMIHTYVWHDSLVCCAWLMHMCDMTLLYVAHDSYISGTWLHRQRRSDFK